MDTTPYAAALHWWLEKVIKKTASYALRVLDSGVVTFDYWVSQEVQKPTSDQLQSIVKDYVNSKWYRKEGFSYQLCMEDLNRAFWERMSIIAPVVGLIDLWTRWKNFSALKVQSLSWVEDGTLTQADFDAMNSVYKKQGIDLMLW